MPSKSNRIVQMEQHAGGSISALCIVQKRRWLRARVRSGNGRGGKITLTFYYEGNQTRSLHGWLSADSHTIQWRNDGRSLWYRINEQQDSSAVLQGDLGLVAHIEKQSRIKRCKHGLFLILLNDLFISESLDMYGEWSEKEVELFLAIVRPGDRVIDAGANIGSFSIPLAKAVGHSGRVDSFEPQRRLSQILAANAAQNE